MNSRRSNATRAEVVEQICDILEPWILNDSLMDGIGEETNLITDLGLDSVGVLNVVLGAEQRFGISIANEELNADVFSKMGNLVSMIQRKTYEANRPAGE
ncbi:MAG: acyl carrier protein [Planctomycetota bacterium]|jgi:acyl carrier protein